jgi:hypothetical protein
MKVGDLITDIDTGGWVTNIPVTGVILSVKRDVEVPPLLEVLWDSGYISKCYSDDVYLVSDKEE